MSALRRSVNLMRGGDTICLEVNTGKRGTRIFLTEERAAHLGHRLMAFAAGQYAIERAVVVEEDYEP